MRIKLICKPLPLQENEVGYRLAEIGVQPYFHEEQVKAKTFVSSPLLLLFAAVAPPERYLKKLQQGAEENGLQAEYREWLASVGSASISDLSDQRYNATAADLLAKFVGLALAFGIPWALIC